MIDWKPKNLEEALDDAIGSALNDNSTEIEDSSRTSLYDVDFDKAIKQAIKNIKDIKELEIKYKEELEEKITIVIKCNRNECLNNVVNDHECYLKEVILGDAGYCLNYKLNKEKSNDND